MIIRPTEERLDSLRKRYHAGCAACGEDDPLGLRLVWNVSRDGAVEGRFFIPPRLRSYDAQLHGGIIALVLDCAMTNCLFAHGQAGVTVDMKVRYLNPAPVGETAECRARMLESGGPLFRLKSEITWNGHTIASAVAKFVQRETADALRSVFGTTETPDD